MSQNGLEAERRWLSRLGRGRGCAEHDSTRSPRASRACASLGLPPQNSKVCVFLEPIAVQFMMESSAVTITDDDATDGMRAAASLAAERRWCQWCVRVYQISFKCPFWRTEIWNCVHSVGPLGQGC